MEEWISLDFLLVHCKGTNWKGIRDWRSYLIASVGEMEEIVRYMDPPDDAWRIACHIDHDVGTHSQEYFLMGKIVRSIGTCSLPWRQIDAPFSHLSMHLDPIYEGATEEDRTPLLQVKWANILTGFLHNQWLHGRSGMISTCAWIDLVEVIGCSWSRFWPESMGIV